MPPPPVEDPVDTVEALQRRIQAARPRDELIGLFFESTLAHLTQVLGPVAAERARHDVLGSPTLSAFVRYPVADLLRLLHHTARHPPVADLHTLTVALGRAAVRHFFGSPLGKAMVLLARGDPHRLLRSAPSGYRAVTSYGERTYASLGARSGRFRFQGELLGPGWQQGVVEESLQRVSGHPVRVRVEEQDPSAADFVLLLEW